MANLLRRTVRQTVREPQVYEEHPAGSVITPGHLVEGVNGTDNIQPHSIQGGKMVPMVATENLRELQGGDINDQYEAGDIVSVIIPSVGDILLMILQDGEDVSKWDYLDSYGDGTLRKNDAGANSVFQAIEDMDLSSSSSGALGESSSVIGENYRIYVRRVV